MLDTFATKLDVLPVSAMWRIALGGLLYPFYALASQGRYPSWAFLAYILFVLIALRIGPLFLRKVMKFSTDSHKVWAERRQLAKQYDSYQWQKLFWIGLGLWGYLRYSGVQARYPIYVAALFTIGGGIGLMIWLFISRKIRLALTVQGV